MNKPTQYIDKVSLVCFVDAAYRNQSTKRKSTTGFDFTFYRDAVFHKSKIQSINALSSTETELIDAVTAADTASFLRYILLELGFTQDSPTTIYEDYYLTIDDVNSSILTEITLHVYICLFAIQGWKEAGYITMHHIPGIINPVDDLIKTFGLVLHYSHDRYLMGHYNISFGSSINAYSIGM